MAPSNVTVFHDGADCCAFPGSRCPCGRVPGSMNDLPTITVGIEGTNVLATRPYQRVRMTKADEWVDSLGHSNLTAA